jgi:Kef-type K+ transport system membrane component KefB
MLLPRKNDILDKIAPKIETFVLVVLLPIFFAQVGGLARFGVIHNYNTILIAIILTVVALLTKFTGVFIGAKIAKYDNAEAAFLGTLLNLRGVFEVVVIKVVWELGLISRTIFVILVVMAIASTWVSTSAALWFRNRLILRYYHKNHLG